MNNAALIGIQTMSDVQVMAESRGGHPESVPEFAGKCL